MLFKLKYINILSSLIILLVNLLFFYKYSVIYTDQPLVLTVIYAAVFVMLITAAFSWKGTASFNKKLVAFISFVIPLIVLFYILSVPRMGEIGRLPAIEDWIYRFQNGLFPYNSPHTPSSFPVIFFLAFPFYIIGNTGLLPFAGICLLFLLMYKEADNPKSFIMRLAVVLMSVVIYYEVVTRSELLFNIMLVAGVVYLSERYLIPAKINFNFFLVAVITGLVLATRSFTALLFLIYFLYSFRNDLGRVILFGLIAAAVFTAILFPFYLWDPESFMTNGPFAVQSYLSNLPFLFIIFIFAAAVYSGWVITDIQEFYFSGGVILFFAALISFLYRVNETGFHNAVINDGYDIAYFIICVPLLILSIKEYKTDKYLGKVFPFS